MDLIICELNLSDGPGEQAIKILSSESPQTPIIVLTAESSPERLAEAQAAGCPVIAFRGGGALEIVLEGVTGFFFDEQSSSSIADAILLFEKSIGKLSPSTIRKNALRFSEARFLREIHDFIEEKSKSNNFPKN